MAPLPTPGRIRLLPVWLVPFLCLRLLHAAVDTTAPDSSHRSFNEGWRFLRGDAAGMERPDFDDRSWRAVDLPHDWSVEDAGRTVLHDPTTPDGANVGWLRGGPGWYRKHFVLPAADRGRAVELVFDGAQQEADVWINGRHLGFQPHGYIGFHFDLTPYLRADGGDNVIAVRTLNPESNTRWYAGSGLYRDVSLRLHGPQHIPVWGARVDTVWLSGGKALIQLQLEVRNDGAAPEDLSLELALTDPAGATSVHSLGSVRVSPQESETVNQQLTLPEAQLWSPDQPRRYVAEFRLKQQDRIVDTYRQPFGVRTVTVSAERGLLLNGSPVKLKGGCLHHDNGLIGAAAFPAAEERRVRLMKRNGFNAIRTSHNPPSSAFLDACDRLGVLVIDEFVDHWELPKKPNGYNRYFAKHWERDLGAMLARDFNHPSVIMWSIGNEIPERVRPAGVEIGRKLAAQCRRVDPRRPVTNAICGFYDNPDLEGQWDASAPGFALLDVGGYNYLWANYETDHLKFPQRVMVGTESFPKEAFENWRMVERNNYVIGDFVWTAMDHIGESGIGHTAYIPSGSDPLKAQPSPWDLMPLPWWINWSGDIDIVGQKKPQSLYRDVVWRESPIELAVHEPIPAGQVENVGAWGWPAELASWNWSGQEGKPLAVNVYARAERVRLELNGRLVGEQHIDAEKGITASFVVNYEPGRLVATALAGDRVLGRKELATTGRAAALRLAPESPRARASRNTLVYVPIEVVDANGAAVPDAATPLTLALDGPAELLGFGSASPTDLEPLRDARATTFHGHALAIVRPTGQPGKLTVTLTAPDLPAARAELELLAP
jgi:beta-galactosidase